MKSVLLIGLGGFGRHIATKINELGHEILAVDQNETRVNSSMSLVTNAQIGDSTDREFLRSLGIDNFDVCIVTIGEDFQSSLETTSLLKELGAPKVISRAMSDVHAKFLLKNGADEVVYPEKQMASWLSIRYTSDTLLDYIELDEDTGIFELAVPENWYGRTVLEVDVRKKYHINILGFRREGKMDLSVSPDSLFTPQEPVLVLGKYKDVHKCFKI